MTMFSFNRVGARPNASARNPSTAASDRQPFAVRLASDVLVAAGILALFGLIVVVIMTLACVIGAIAGVDYATPDLTSMKSGPMPGHPFGTDTIGRDLFARVLYGGCFSILIGVFCAVLSWLSMSKIAVSLSSPPITRSTSPALTLS